MDKNNEPKVTFTCRQFKLISCYAMFPIPSSSQINSAIIHVSVKVSDLPSLDDR